MGEAGFGNLDVFLHDRISTDFVNTDITTGSVRIDFADNVVGETAYNIAEPVHDYSHLRYAGVLAFYKGLAGANEYRFAAGTFINTARAYIIAPARRAARVVTSTFSIKNAIDYTTYSQTTNHATLANPQHHDADSLFCLGWTPSIVGVNAADPRTTIREGFGWMNYDGPANEAGYDTNTNYFDQRFIKTAFGTQFPTSFQSIADNTFLLRDVVFDDSIDHIFLRVYASVLPVQGFPNGAVVAGENRSHYVYIPRYASGKDQFQARVWFQTGGTDRMQMHIKEGRWYNPITGAVEGLNAALTTILTAGGVTRTIIVPDPVMMANVAGDASGALRAMSAARGPVFRSVKRISQHLCAPLINPNQRIGSQAPLNSDSRHLPPEMRDFRVRLLDCDWARLRASSVTVGQLTMYEFRGGNQQVAAEPHLMYLPRVVEHRP